MDIDTVSIIVTILGIGFIIIGIIVGLGLTIIGALGNYKFNKLIVQIESVEIKLRAELSRIDSEIYLLRESHTIKIDALNNGINDRIKALEDAIRSNDTRPIQKEPGHNIEQSVTVSTNQPKSNEGEFPYDKYRENIGS